jgi:enamine deaminase RidA (YjgF/YER057c/UK114 family)
VYKQAFGIDNKGFENIHAMGLIKPAYQIIYPTRNGNFKNQWDSCLEQIESIQDNPIDALTRVNIFVNSENQADYLLKQQVVKGSFMDCFGSQCPPFGVVMQAPEGPNQVVCEIGIVNKHSANVSYGFFHEIPYCVVDAGNYKEYWTIGAHSVKPDFNIKASSKAAFTYLKDLYQHLGLSFNNIVRQWNYVGEILSKEQEEGRLRQHYQMFNETRSEYYGNYRTRNDFPAATGIGMLYQGVCIDSFAVSGDESLKVVPVSNPAQSESYCYSQEVLVGSPEIARKQNQPPQFERAKLLVLNRVSRLIVSGTASIIGQQTVGIGDVEEQTRVTIGNIKRLADPDHLQKLCPDMVHAPDKYSYIRVYVKLKEDISKVRNICQQFFGNVPATYVVADICRDDLLVEIEAELLST